MPIFNRAKAGTAATEPTAGSTHPQGGLETQVRDLEQLREVMMRLARITDHAAALQEVLRAVTHALGSGRGLIALSGGEAEGWRIGASCELPEAFLRAWLEAPAGVGGKAAVRRERVVVVDVAADPSSHGDAGLVRLGKFAAWHSLPLLTPDERVIGVLTVMFDARHEPDERERRLMDLYARMVADVVVRDEVLEGVRASEARFRTLAAKAPVGIFWSDAKGESIFVNQRWCEMAGLSEAEARGAGWQRAVHPDDRERVAADWRAAVMAGRSSETTFRFLQPNGTVVWLHGNATALHNAAGEVTGYIGTVADVTESQRTQAVVQDREKRYRELVESLPVAVYTTDGEGRVELFNRAAVELWGREPERTRDRWCGATRLRSAGGAALPFEESPLAVALREGRAARGIEVEIERPDGGRRVVLENPHPFFDAEGRVSGGVNVLLDVTEFRYANTQSRLFAAIIESTNDAILSTDLDGIITSWNRGAERLYGYTAQEAVGKSVLILLPEGREGEETDIFERMRLGQRIEPYETVRRRKDGTLVEVSLTASPVKEADGRVIGASKISRNVTEQKKVEAELRRRERLYRAVGDAVDFGIWIGDAEGRNIYLSDSFLRMVGMTQEECAGDSWARALPPEDVGPTLAAWKECVRTGERWEREHRYKGADGVWHPVLSRGVPIRDDRGVITHWAGINLDISDYKRAEEQLRRSEQQLRLVTDSAMVFLAHCDREHRLKFVNRPYAARFGRDPQDLVGKSIVDLVGAAAYATFRPYIEMTLAGQRVEFEIEIPYERFGKRWVHVVHEPERAPDGAVMGLVAVITDVTARKQVERDMEMARDRAVAASRAKDDFLAALSHELRTPLNPALLIASEAAENPNLPAEVRADFRTIRRNIQLEARLIDDLLDMTRITRGKLPLELGVQDVNVVVRDALMTMRPEFAQKQIAPEVEIATQPMIAWCDAARLQQVLWNVLKNAVKFTPVGGRIAVRTWSDAGGGTVNIEVRDSGIGMTPAELSRAFEAFSQGDHAVTGGSHQFGGVGLGLAISRMLVEQHHGSIAASSEGRDKGSSFVISLPLMTPEELEARGGLATRAVTQAPFRGAASANEPRRTILLVEDHEPTRTAMEFLLRRRNYDVVAAGTVKDGLHLARERHIDLVISDIGLPDGNGYELMAELRATAGLNGIALTGYGMDHDIVRSQAAGFRLHLTKPVTIQSLDKALGMLAEKGTESE